MDERYKVAAKTESFLINDIQRLVNDVEIKIGIQENCHQRTSTPILGNIVTYDELLSPPLRDGYEKWLHKLKTTKPLHKVRGVRVSVNGIISGNLIPLTEKKVQTNELCCCDYENIANERLKYSVSEIMFLSTISGNCKELLRKAVNKLFNRGSLGHSKCNNNKCVCRLNVNSCITQR